MKIALDWLKEHIDFEESADTIADILTKSGLEVEGVEKFSTIDADISSLVVGEVLSCTKHPDADKLSLTEINVGGEEPLPIVCGAPNVAAGQKVVVAQVGTVLTPGEGDPFKIKKSKIRGQLSMGMLCAEDEIGLGASHDGIMVLAAEAEAGQPINKYISGFSDEILEIGLTPNRADGMSHLGAARDLSILLERPLKEESVSINYKDTDNGFKLTVENEEACPRYTGVTISGVSVAPSPEWLQNRLRSLDLAPINNVVDITNFILHDLGQPLHAFDAAKITTKEVRVKTLAKGTAFKTLDDVDRKLNDYDLMICNGDEPMCIAGVFGGADSGVADGTTDIFLESAYFSDSHVRKTSLAHGLKTDASFRFERGTDPNSCVIALEKATKLILDICGGEVSSKLFDTHPETFEGFKFNVDLDRICRLLGTDLDHHYMLKLLQGLEIKTTQVDGAVYALEVPPYRVDVQREADIAEEILRLYGYDNIELSYDLSSSYLAPSNEVDEKEDEKVNISSFLAGKGFNEIYTNSLTKPDFTEDIEAINQEAYVPMLNKLSEELSVMRQTNLFSGLEVIKNNINRQQTNLRLFEFGKVYKKEEEFEEKEYLCLYISGNEKAESWQQKSAQNSYHNLAQAVLDLFEKQGLTKFKQVPLEDELFAGGVELKIKKHSLAKVGQVSKKQLKKIGVSQDVFYAEIDMDVLLRPHGALIAEPLSKFPAVRRDLSIVVDKSVTFDQVKEIANRSKGIITYINVFDVYEGKPLEDHQKSYSVYFMLEDKEQTLTDKVIDKTMGKLIRMFEGELSATIRK